MNLNAGLAGCAAGGGTALLLSNIRLLAGLNPQRWHRDEIGRSREWLARRNSPRKEKD